MKSVLCFGEALIDFLHIDAIEQDKLSLPAFRQYPGGAPANAAVAVSKLGGNAKFAGQVGQDAFGDFLQNALEQYGVNTEFLARHSSAKTALAFVMLDDSGDRSFSFYRDNSADVLFDYAQATDSWFVEQTILHFCSNTLTTQDIAHCTTKVVQQAKRQESLVSFDVNLRHNLWSTQAADRDLVNSLVWQSDVVKFSKEELLYLAENAPQAYIDNCLKQQCQLLVVTDGEASVEYFGQSCKGVVQPPKVKAVDTTAGGDAFVGGMLYVLSQFDQPASALADRLDIEGVLAFASCCGALAVTKPGAFPALPSNDAVLTMLNDNQYDISTINHLVNRP